MNADAEKPNGRRWVRLKLTFTDTVMDDKGVPPIPFKLAAALARYADAETGIVDKSQAFLADVVNVKLRALQLAIDLLAKRGHVVVLTPKGRKLGNRYRPVLRPKDDPDPVHVHDGAHENGLVHMHDGAHEADFHAHETAISYAPGCASLTPVLYPVIDSSVSEATVGRPAKAGTTTTIDIDDGLLDEIRTAVEAAGGKLVRRPHRLQPIRDLIAGGIPRAEVVASIAAAASRLKAPLGNLDPGWLLDHIRDRAVADGYGPSTSASSSSDHGSTVPDRTAPPGYVVAGEAMHSRARVAAARKQFDESGSWSAEFGMPPDSPLADVPEEFRGPRRKPASPISSPDPEKDGSGTRNNA